MSFSKDDLLLYAVTDRKSADFGVLYEQVRQALEGGVTMVQLREKNLGDEEFISEAIKLKELCESRGVPLIINDNLAVALKSGADGIHVGIEDMPVSEIRRQTGEGFIIGATAKTVEQAQIAEREGADYLGIGAVFPSQNAVRITNEQLNQIASSVSIPSVAIGGINLKNIEQIKCNKISGIAVVSALFSADDIKTAAQQLKEKAKAVAE